MNLFVQPKKFFTLKTTLKKREKKKILEFAKLFYVINNSFTLVSHR